MYEFVDEVRLVEVISNGVEFFVGWDFFIVNKNKCYKYWIFLYRGCGFYIVVEVLKIFN